VTSWRIMRDAQEPVFHGINLTLLVLHLVHFCCEIWNSHNYEQKDYKMDKACVARNACSFLPMYTASDLRRRALLRFFHHEQLLGPQLPSVFTDVTANGLTETMKVQGECSTDETPGCCMTYQVNHLYRRPGAYRTHTLTRSLTPATTVHKRTGRITDSPTELGSLFTSRNGFSATDCLRPHDHSCTPYLLETVSGFVHTFGHFRPL